MKNIFLINILFLIIIFTNTALGIPSITSTTSVNTTIKFTATLSEKILSGYKVKIDYGSKKGLVNMNCFGINCTLSSNYLPVGVNTEYYKIGIFHTEGGLQGKRTYGIYTIKDSMPVAIYSSRPYITAYSKISNSGETLPDTAKLGKGENDWACTKDNKTGLTWEIKTTEGLGYMDSLYTNYGEGEQGSYLTESGYGARNNTDRFIKYMNNRKLCGKTDWRLPTKDELLSLIACFDKSCSDNYVASVNQFYFPNTRTLQLYWSSSLYNHNYHEPNSTNHASDSLWGVSFNDGATYGNRKGIVNYVRLVR